MRQVLKTCLRCHQDLLHKIHVTVLVKYTVIPLSHSCPLIQSAGDQTQPGFCQSYLTLLYSMCIG